MPANRWSHWRSPLRIILAAFLLISLLSSPFRAQTRDDGLNETITIRVNEGTHLSFDLSSDGRFIVFDLLGQLWLMPAEGGEARPITDAVRDIAEDSDPSFSPDGRRIVFQSERNGRTGLWLLNLDSGGPRQLTQLSDPEGAEGNPAWSPDGRSIAFTRRAPLDVNPAVNGFAIFLLDVDSGTTRRLEIAGVPPSNSSEPRWIRGGHEISFAGGKASGGRGARIWTVPSVGGRATAITDESVPLLAPGFSPDGRSVAYFALDSTERIQVWVQKLTDAGLRDGPPLRVTNHADVTPTHHARDGPLLTSVAARCRWHGGERAFWSLRTSREHSYL